MQGGFLEAIKALTNIMDKCDVVVPLNQIVEFVNYTHEVIRMTNIRIPSIDHASDGNLHVYICKDNLTNEEREVMLELTFDLL